MSFNWFRSQFTGTMEPRNSSTFHVTPMYNWVMICTIKIMKCVLSMASQHKPLNNLHYSLGAVELM
jgi:hypothetical protein